MDLQQQCTGASLSLLFPLGDPNITRNFGLFPTAITDRVLGQLTPIHQSIEFWGCLPASFWVGRPRKHNTVFDSRRQNTVFDTEHRDRSWQCPRSKWGVSPRRVASWPPPWRTPRTPLTSTTNHWRIFLAYGISFQTHPSRQSASAQTINRNLN